MLLFVVAVFPDLLPRFEVDLLRWDAFAALGYVANWRMIYRGDDYFAQTAAPSPLQHTWSLGIEEQFYVVWPLLVVALLAFGLRRAMVGLCLLGAAMSALLAVLLFDPFAVNRAYFGTDTRAQALLIGCALAAGLMAVRRKEPATVRPEPPALSVAAAGALTFAAMVAVGVILWLWTHASGSRPAALPRRPRRRRRRRRGGAGARRTAAVRFPRPSLSSVTPLVWLGRISYGVYLWHWPLFALINADRTGLAGGALLAVRLAATIAVSAISYVLVGAAHPDRSLAVATLPTTDRDRCRSAPGSERRRLSVRPRPSSSLPPPCRPGWRSSPSWRSRRLDPNAVSSGRTAPIQRENRKPGARSPDHLLRRLGVMDVSAHTCRNSRASRSPPRPCRAAASPDCRRSSTSVSRTRTTRTATCWDEIWRLRRRRRRS